MTFVQVNRPARKTFNSLFENFFNDFTTNPGQSFASNIYRNAPVNIKETNEGYIVELLAPGFEKSELKVDMENGMLIISAERKEEATAETEKQIRKEFTISSFKRSFALDEKINAEAIEAKYENGLLRLNLPKKTEVKPAAKQITIS